MVDAVATGEAAVLDDTPEVAPPASLGYRRYALGLLLIIYVLNFLDRQVVNILAEAIKKDLHLQDWQLGLMTGTVFAIFYTFLGIPIARLAERFSRPWIMAGAMALWSGFTVLCGLSRTFPQLLGARLGVGFGEAGCTPSAHSMIADDTPPKDRSFALAFYAMGTPLGTLLGFAMGGLVADHYGWRVAFMVAGAPGLFFALIAGLTLREPRKRMAARVGAPKALTAGFIETVAYLLRKPTFWLVGFAAGIFAFMGYGQNAFISSFFLRNFKPEIAQLGAHFGQNGVGFIGPAIGIVGGLAGAFGSVFGGRVTDRAGAKDPKAFATLPAIALGIAAPLYALVILAPSATIALALLVIPSVLGTFWYGPIYGTAQSVVPPHMRATAAAVILFIINIIGLGFGPLCFGFLSDFLSGPMALGTAASIKWTLILSTTLTIPAVILLLFARRTITADRVS